MAILTVGSTSTFPTIAAAMAAAGTGDIISLEAGYGNENATVTVDGLSFDGGSTSTNINLQLVTGIAAITLLGTAPINVLDNAADGNGINGNDGNNVITVTGGADAVSGELGIDRLVVDYRLTSGAVTGNSTTNIADAGGLGIVTINGGFEHFTILTGSGADTITTGAGDDIINTGEGASTVTAGAGANRITGGSGADTVTALDGGNFIDGGGGDNTLTSGGGNDEITGGLGVDTIVAGGGDDLITVRGGADTSNSGAGNDRLIVDYSTSTTAVTGGVTGGGLMSGYSGHIADLAGNSIDFLTTENFTVTTGSGNDVITAGDGNDVLDGGAGSDQLNGGGGSDTLLIGLGDDTLDGGANSDTVMFSGARANYQVNNLGNGVIQTIDLRSGSPDGTDTLVNMEGFVFTDGTFDATTILNVAPTLGGDLAIAVANGGTVIVTAADLTATDADSTNAQLVYTVTGALHGTVLLAGIAATSFTEADILANTVSFQHDGSASNGSFTVSLTDGTAVPQMATVIATAGNAPPSATNDALSAVAEDSGQRTILGSTLTGNDSAGPASEGGQTLTVTAVSNVIGGSASVSGGNVLFTPTANFNGAASFDYTVTDNGSTNGVADSLTATATASLTVTEVNDAPSGTNDALSTIAEDSGQRTILGSSLTGNDSAGPASESGQTLTVTAVSNVIGGSASVSGGNVLFTPTANFNGAASFDYTVTDNGTTSGVSAPLTATATASFTITEVNDAPTATNDTLGAVAEDSGQRTILGSTLTGNDSTGPSSESGQTLTLTGVSNVIGGSASVSGGNVLFTPTANFNGAASFDYTVTDNGTTSGTSAPLTATATASFTVTEVNDAPSTTNDALSAVAEDSGQRTILGSALTGNDSAGPASESGQTLTITAVGNAIGGSASVSGGNVLFTPTADFNGAASFDYTVTDNGTTNGIADPLTTTATASFTINAVDEPSTILTVGPTSTFPTIAAAMAAAGTGDIISLEAGYGNENAMVTVDGLSFDGGPSSTDINLQLVTGISAITLLGTAPINVIGGPDANAIVGNDGDNIVTVSGGVDVVTAGNGTDRLIIDYSAATASVTGTTINVTDGGTHAVTFTGVENFTITTGSGNDTITVADGSNVVNTGGGDDTITAGNGPNIIDGGANNDTITAGSGVNTIDGGLGNDTIVAGDGGNTVNGGGGDDGISTGIGDDVVIAGLGNDTILTSAGADVTTVNGGIDTVDSGSESDRLIVDFSSSTTNVNGGVTGGTLAGGYDGAFANVAGTSSVVFQQTENFTITTGSGNDVIATGDGDDVLDGGAGGDQLNGGGGADTLLIGLGSDALDGGAGTDTTIFSAARSNYQVNDLGGGVIQTIDLRAGSPDGTDTLVNMEGFVFTDGTFDAVTVLNDRPVLGGDMAIAVANGGTVLVNAADLTATDSDNTNSQLVYTVTGALHGAVLLAGVAAASFTEADILANAVSFQHDGSAINGSFTVSLTDGASAPQVATVIAAVDLPTNAAPTITSDGGGATASVPVAENTTTVTTVTANDPDAGTTLGYTIVGGDDAAKFTINGSTGALSFVAAPDFETPGDADDNNSYLVQIRASDGSLSDDQALTVTVTDVDESSVVLTGTPGDDSFTALPGTERINAGMGIDTVSFGFRLVDATVSYVGNTVVIDGPSSHTVLTGFETYTFTDGTVNNNDGSWLIDDLFYNSQYHDVWNAHVDADVHYNLYGWHEARDPSAFFDTSLYLSLNSDVKASGANPLVQYDQTGWKEGDVPSFAFDGAKYLAANLDVAAAHVDPLEHFLANGAEEGRQPFAVTEMLAPNGFDYVYYLQHNPDVAAAGVDPFQHYETMGWHEGRNPNALFDTAGYLANYADVAAAGINPLDHYHSSGWHEGRDPSVNFDTASYLAAYPDVAAAPIDPLLHFLANGIHEGRSTFADGHFG